MRPWLIEARELNRKIRDARTFDEYLSASFRRMSHDIFRPSPLMGLFRKMAAATPPGEPIVVDMDYR